MAMQRTFFERAKSITGVALIALGIFIFGENLGPAVSQLSHVLDTIPREALGAVSTLVLAALRVVKAYPADHQRFLQALLHQMLVSSWPLLLVAIGTALSRDALTDTVNTLTKKRLWTCRSDRRPVDVKVEVIKLKKETDNAMHGGGQSQQGF